MPGQGRPGHTFKEDSMIINHNMSALFTERNLKFNNHCVGQGHGEALLRPADQQGRRRRLGSRRVGENEVADPRPADGGTELAERHLLHPDGRRVPPGEPGHPAAAARAVGAGVQRDLLQRRPDADPGRGFPAGQRGQPHRLARAVQRHEHAHRPVRQGHRERTSSPPACGCTSAPTWTSACRSSSGR